MARIHSIMAALVMSSAAISMPAGAQMGSVSLTHTVSVSVPPRRMKVQVANLAFSSPTPASVSSVQPKANGLAITINATQAWVLSIGSASGVTVPKSRVQWSTDGSTGFSPLTPANVAVASGASYDAKAANVFFRGQPSASNSRRDAEIVVLSISAP
jgi:hypothetical protein